MANLPETVMMIFQDAIDSANKGIVNWLFKHKSVKLLSLLSLPYTLPADVVYASFTKCVLKNFHFKIDLTNFSNAFSRFLMNAPKLQQGVQEMLSYFLEQLSFIFPNINIYYQPISQTIKCHVNITEFRSSEFQKQFFFN